MLERRTTAFVDMRGWRGDLLGMKKPPLALLPFLFLAGCPEPTETPDAFVANDALANDDAVNTDAAIPTDDAFTPRPDAYETPDAYVPLDALDLCAGASCGPFERCAPTTGLCVAACSCPGGGLCDTSSGACIPAGNSATEACASVPVLNAPSSSGATPLLVQGDFTAASRNFAISGGIPGMISCYVEPALVDQVVRVRFSVESTYRFEVVTEHSTAARTSISVMSDATCTETTSACVGAGTRLYTPGEYSVIVSGTPAMGRWTLRITRS